MQGAASWLIVSAVSLTASVPLRVACSPFDPTLKSTAPLPWPDAGEVIEIHGVEDVADHVQSRVVLTETLPEPPEAGADAIELVAVTWHLTVVGASTLIEEEPHATAANDNATDQPTRTTAETRGTFMGTRHKCKRVALDPTVRAQRYRARDGDARDVASRDHRSQMTRSTVDAVAAEEAAIAHIR